MIESHSFGDIAIYFAPIERLSDESRSESERLITDQVISRVLGDKVSVARQPSGAPYLVGSELFVSVSHSRRLVAVALSANGPIGVDVEEYRPQLKRVAPRVLSEPELTVYAGSTDALLRAWTLKEALYKAALTPGLDFRSDISLPLDPDDTTALVVKCPYIITSFPVAGSLISVARPQ